MLTQPERNFFGGFWTLGGALCTSRKTSWHVILPVFLIMLLQIFFATYILHKYLQINALYRVVFGFLFVLQEYIYEFEKKWTCHFLLGGHLALYGTDLTFIHTGIITSYYDHKWMDMGPLDRPHETIFPPLHHPWPCSVDRYITFDQVLFGSEIAITIRLMTLSSKTMTDKYLHVVLGAVWVRVISFKTPK